MQDEIIHNFYLTLKEEQYERIYDNLNDETFKRLLQSVTTKNSEDIKQIISDMKKKKVSHEVLIKELRDEHYNSAQLLPFFRRNIVESDGINDPDSKRS